MPVADFGVANVHTETVQARELLLLKANSRDSMGRLCVHSCESMMGWVCREGSFVQVEYPLSELTWGELYLRKKGGQ